MKDKYFSFDDLLKPGATDLLMEEGFSLMRGTNGYVIYQKDDQRKIFGSYKKKEDATTTV